MKLATAWGRGWVEFGFRFRSREWRRVQLFMIDAWSGERVLDFDVDGTGLRPILDLFTRRALGI